MRACATAAASAAPTPRQRNDAVQLSPSAQRDIVDVLAAMALTITPEVRT